MEWSGEGVECCGCGVVWGGCGVVGVEWSGEDVYMQCNRFARVIHLSPCFQAFLQYIEPTMQYADIVVPRG